jgi:putative peptidoglycan lipid II flippase
MAEAANTAVSEVSSTGGNGDRPASGAGRVARATGMMIALVLLSRVLGVVRDIVLAYFFGQDVITDTYTAAFRVPDMLYLLVAGGALSSVFVPVFTQYINDRREDDAWRTFGSFITIVGVVAAGLVLVMEIAADFVTRLLFPLFSQPVVAETAALSRILLPAQWCFFVGGLMMGVLQARGRFLVPALGPVIYNITIILGGLLGGWLFYRQPQVGISLMTWGALIGAVVGNFLLPLWDLRRSGARWKLGIDLRHPGVVRVGRLLLPAVLGLSLSQLGFWITQSFLPEGGEISALKYAYNLTQAPIGIFAQASAIVLFPTISLLAAQKDWPAFRTEVSQGIRRILFLTVPASLLMTVLAEPIIRLLYAGPRYGDAEIAQAASALRIYSLGTFAWSAQAVLGRGFFAMQDTRTPLSITKAMIVLFTLSCFALNYLLGFEGLALAMSLVATVNMGIFLVLLGRRVGGLDIRGMARSAARIFAAAALSGGAAWGVLRALDAVIADTKPGAALQLAVAGGVALAVYVGACALLRVPELSGVRAMFRRRG